ncbi:hypothetical protein WJX75_008372 [Coccomyxa subellipsoidea]|uniref:Uncharacterized protein n=1 Tax=Coccomyxa subellipsoidea TaxID=248742 RepID=A0ABR2YYC8_9CHLO
MLVTGGGSLDSDNMAVDSDAVPDTPPDANGTHD